MELREPKRKRRVRILQQPFPFPILNRDVTSIPTNKALWQVYTGRYSGDFVVVDAPDEMAALHNMGFFGKGTLSRGGPEFGKEKQGLPPFIRQRQWEQRCRWAEQQENMLKEFRRSHKKIKTLEEKRRTEEAPTAADTDKKQGSGNEEIDVETVTENEDVDVTTSKMDDDVITLDSAEEDNVGKTEKVGGEKEKTEESKEEKENKRKHGMGSENEDSDDTSASVEMKKGGMLVVLPDSDDDDEGYLTHLCPKLEKEVFPIRESLHLTLEESFFLSYGLGCLQVIDMFGGCLAIDGMWQLFCKSQKDFIQNYVAYHYFRSKGWVIKPGIKFGGDFLLYKQGPPFYHASYIVLVEVIRSSSLERVHTLRPAMTWTRLFGLNRVAESAGKEIIICQVIWPPDVNPNDLEFPSVLSKFQVHEVLVRRWISSQEREENESL